jgi:NADPH:quinone reductase-like Zn-dependent oxidoreductase
MVHLRARMEVASTIFEWTTTQSRQSALPALVSMCWVVSILPTTCWADSTATLNPQKLPAAKKYIYARLADGRFRPKIARTFPFAQTVQAYKYLGSNAQVGKL